MPTPPQPTRQPEDTQFGARIKVVGVGGGGSNAINRMISSGIEGVEFIAINTDIQSLQESRADIRGQIGARLTNGLSAGSDPDIGRRAALEESEQILEALDGADMVFVTAGLGGGTGTGAAPVIAALASEMGALTIAIVTRPFGFEGKRRMAIADWGIQHLLNYVDTLIVIPNEKLLAVAKDAPFFDSFRIADDFLREAVQGISDIITTSGVINRDFADVKTTLAGMGYAVMGTAARSGPTRAVDAVMAAMESPLLEAGAIDGARGILINITGSSSLRLSEVNDASNVIQNLAHEDANIIFGAVLDERLGDEVKVTVIASGFSADGRDRTERRARMLREAEAELEPSSPAPGVPVVTAPVMTQVSPQITAPISPQTGEEQDLQGPLAELAGLPAATPSEWPDEPLEAAPEEAQQSQTFEVAEEPVEHATSPAAQTIEPPSEVQQAPEVHQQDIEPDLPPNERQVELDAPEDPAEAQASVEVASEEPYAELDEEADWLAAIREIARLAEPELQATTPGEDQPPAAPPVQAPVPPQVVQTRMAAFAAYTAVSTPEDEPESEPLPDSEHSGFAEIFDARRRFAENLGTPSHSSAISPKVHEAPQPATSSQAAEQLSRVPPQQKPQPEVIPPTPWLTPEKNPQVRKGSFLRRATLFGFSLSREEDEPSEPGQPLQQNDGATDHQDPQQRTEQPDKRELDLPPFLRRR